MGPIPESKLRFRDKQPFQTGLFRDKRPIFTRILRDSHLVFPFKIKQIRLAKVDLSKRSMNTQGLLFPKVIQILGLQELIDLRRLKAQSHFGVSVILVSKHTMI